MSKRYHLNIIFPFQIDTAICIHVATVLKQTRVVSRGVEMEEETRCKLAAEAGNRKRKMRTSQAGNRLHYGAGSRW